MTLHWWMHWFWVTTLLSLLFCSSGIHTAPQSEELQHITTDIEPDPYKHTERQGRAMYFTKTSYAPTTNKPPPVVPITNNNTKKIDVTTLEPDKVNDTIPVNATDEIVHPSIIEENTTEVTTTSTETPEVTIKNVTKTVETNVEKNMTTTGNVTATVTKKKNLTRHTEVKDIDGLEGASESRIVTERPLSLETAFLQTRIPPNIESSRRVIDQGERNPIDTGAIAGISFAALVVVALIGSTAFVLYRRRYLNKPQTLNDKCSNPDSSGYLDDSTIRDNSEEMYSLDNDSFLNSLEAMTIQNYWTDTVKHTKL